MTGFVPRKFRERSAVVEAVQLTDADDWDIVGVWCDGQVYDSLGFIAVGVKHAGVGDWICRRGDGTHTVLSPAEFKDRQLIADDDRGGLRVVSTAAELRRLADEVERTHDRAILEDRHWMAWTIREADVTHGRVRAVIYGHLTQVMCEEIDDAWASERGPWRVLHGPEATP